MVAGAILTITFVETLFPVNWLSCGKNFLYNYRGRKIVAGWYAATRPEWKFNKQKRSLTLDGENKVLYDLFYPSTHTCCSRIHQEVAEGSLSGVEMLVCNTNAKIMYFPGKNSLKSEHWSITRTIAERLKNSKAEWRSSLCVLYSPSQWSSFKMCVQQKWRKKSDQVVYYPNLKPVWL